MDPFEIFDAQLHVWLPREAPGYPWDPDYPRSFFSTRVPPHPVERVLADMDAAGVDAALAVVPRLYGWDNGYALAAAAAHPERLGVVGRIDPLAPDPLGRLRELLARPGMVGIRLATGGAPEPWRQGGAFTALLDAAEQLDAPVSGSPGPANLAVWKDLARRRPGLRLVLDHLGMEAPPTSVPEPGPEPFRRLPDLLALADHPNVHVKLTGAAALSNEPFPFRDIWKPVGAVIAAFGAARVMWGSDYNRVSTLVGYRDGVRYLAELPGLTEDELRRLYGATLRRVFGLSTAAATGSRSINSSQGSTPSQPGSSRQDDAISSGFRSGS